MKLEQLVERARERGPMTKEEIDAQRRSYVIAETGFGSDEDEAAMRAAVEKGDLDWIAQLNREAEDRMRTALGIMV